MVMETFVVTEESGLHARPASVLVQTASKFKAELRIEYDGRSVNLKSIVGVMSLGVPQGHSFTISSFGEDEEEAIAKLSSIIIGQGLGQ
ncbi:phosphocarrier protein HPr [Paenibacillus sp. LMG 31459]|jgi:phosphocarrier protein|uniref:Phosphocarrier protein HPr n=2 Tax=Paenibacillus TaxID=44249 RepID=A0A089L6W4_PAEBO|nr:MULTISPECIES: phosphocarrier protein HPr [Paenibacillus]AIQ56522.1 phosphocarrier protein HPr [Paenibacillus borealis]NOU83318.1 phosphocarrier protein HPr [Paenibacillus phytohabitans]